MRTDKLILGLVGAAAAGYALGVLFAPEKGSETRKKIADKGNDLKKSLKSTVDSLINTAKEDFSNLTENAKEELSQDLQNLKSINKSIM
ncbi:YtxH domain-containing protein [Flavobacterium sp. H122]|uniref:YtxH domain-containing protein n=1 Tax=Flavobacterium sp. H122 TaxID=2529860 RepID=UPI0010AABCEF|nr:YtxH domain-containing protein [Flavobacterium sp. H122]